MAPIPVRSASLLTSGETRPVVHLHFSQNLNPTPTPSHLLLSSCKDGKPILRNWLGDWLGTFGHSGVGHSGAIWCARLSANGQLAATGSADYDAKVWDTIEGKELNSFRHEHIVRSVELSQDLKELVTAGNEKKIRIWNVENGSNVEFGKGSSHTVPIKSVVWDGENGIISSGADSLLFWDKRTLTETHSIKFDDPITFMEKSTDGNTITVCAGNQITFLDIESRLPTIQQKLNYSPSTASLHPIHQETFVTGSQEDGWVRLHDSKTGVEKEIGKGHFGGIYCIAFSPDGECYSSASEDGTVRLWQTEPKSYGLWNCV